MFTISNQSDYAVLLIEYLARKIKPTSISQIVKVCGLPRRFLARIAAQLVKADILESKEGIKGGYKLAKPLNQIKLYEVLQIFEKDLELIKCADEKYQCKWQKICKHQSFWKEKLKNQFIKNIKNLTFEDITC